MVKLGNLPIDGTIIKAKASNQHSISEEDLELVQKLIDKGILADMEEDDLYGDEREISCLQEVKTKYVK